MCLPPVVIAPFRRDTTRPPVGRRPGHALPRTDTDEPKERTLTNAAGHAVNRLLARTEQRHRPPRSVGADVDVVSGSGVRARPAGIRPGSGYRDPLPGMPRGPRRNRIRSRVAGSCQAGGSYPEAGSCRAVGNCPEPVAGWGRAADRAVRPDPTADRRADRTEGLAASMAGPAASTAAVC